MSDRDLIAVSSFFIDHVVKQSHDTGIDIALFYVFYSNFTKYLT